MLKKSLIANAFLAIALAYDMRIQHKNSVKFNRILDENETVNTQLTYTKAQVKFLCDIIERNDFDLDDFDRIAIYNL